MELLGYLRRQFVYDEWANRQLLVGLKASASATERSRQLLAHILSAERLWLQRIRKQPQSMAVWPDLSFDQCATEIGGLGQNWREFLDQSTPATLAEIVAYKNSKGESWSNTVGDIVTHVLLHSSYHRGQIASAVRAGGDTPIYTDFIHAVRGHLVE
jgi:uncharacterized damage-inducible protein DinB